ncbi:MAG: hypothetical protein PHV34_23025 [Verrucomicrobiae bacterium]|nr:hypothetical protein [Verrucomicrobiae bacterium]
MQLLQVAMNDDKREKEKNQIPPSKPNEEITDEELLRQVAGGQGVGDMRNTLTTCSAQTCRAQQC